ncbi:MAG TPA: O-antigen ligase family protein [Blastocatellia bacterium]|nr:O-antigen ligase family protein [Blastocatellia bacterium]
MESRLDQAVVTGLFMTVAFTALAHGTVEPWSVGIFRLMMTVLLVIWIVRSVIEGELVLTIASTLRPVMAFFVLGLAQCLSFTDSGGHLRALSVNVEATRMTVATFFFILAGGVMAATFLVGPERLQMVARTLVIYGMALSLFALVQNFAWSGSFYWLRPLTWEASSVFGPFVNHNHFAGYVELLIPLPIALIVTGAVRGAERLFYGFAAALMGVAVVFTLSRGGIISLLAQLILIALLGRRVAREREAERYSDWKDEQPGRIPSVVAAFLSRVGAVAAISLVILVGIFWIDAEPVIQRVTRGQMLSAEAAPQTETFFSSRGWIWKDTLKMIRANPVSGVGLGAYATAYPIYSGSDELNVSQAHNDYLQVLADGGFIGGAIAVWFLIAVFQAIRRSCRARDPLLAGLALGCSTAIVGLLIHSLFDFNLQLPSTSLLFLIMTAILSHLATAATEKASLENRASIRNINEGRRGQGGFGSFAE